jgi:hypothetical protein
VIKDRDELDRHRPDFGGARNFFGSLLRAENCMEHQYIEKHNIVDRYLLGKLPVEELIRFEEHFLDCRQCTEWLNTIERLRGGLQTMAAEETARSRTYLQTGLLSRLVLLNRARRAIWLTGVALLVLLPMVVLTLEWIDARRDLARATQTSSEWRRKYEEREQAERGLIKDMQVRELQSSAQLNQLIAQLEAERKERQRLAGEVNRTAGARVSVPVFALSVIRGDASDLTEPANRIKLSSSSQAMIFLLELGPESNLRSYRVIISTAEGRRVWRTDNLESASPGVLALSLNSGLFKQDDYLLTLEGRTAQGNYVPIARYALRVFIQ